MLMTCLLSCFADPTKQLRVHESNLELNCGYKLFAKKLTDVKVSGTPGENLMPLILPSTLS